MVLLDAGWSCLQVANALVLDEDTVRGWHKLFKQGRIEGLTRFDVDGSVSYLSASQEDALKAWVSVVLPGSNRRRKYRDSVTDNFRVINPKEFSGYDVNRVYLKNAGQRSAKSSLDVG
jgi:hypothetical protein